VLRVLEARGPDWSNSLVAAREDRAQHLRSHPRRLVLVACSAVPLQARGGGTLCSLFLSVIFVQFEIDGYIADIGRAVDVFSVSSSRAREKIEVDDRRSSRRDWWNVGPFPAGIFSFSTLDMCDNIATDIHAIHARRACFLHVHRFNYHFQIPCSHLRHCVNSQTRSLYELARSGTRDGEPAIRPFPRDRFASEFQRVASTREITNTNNIVPKSYDLRRLLTAIRPHSTGLNFFRTADRREYR